MLRLFIQLISSNHFIVFISFRFCFLLQEWNVVFEKIMLQAPDVWDAEQYANVKYVFRFPLSSKVSIF